MNKSELAEALASKCGLSKNQAAQVVTALFDGESGIVAATLKGGGEVNLQGFGTFKVTTRAARTAINPKTKQKIAVPAKSAPKFKAGKTFAESIG